MTPPKQHLNTNVFPLEQPIVNAMLDLTLQCNLRCRYCFKEKSDNGSMSLQTARDAIIWLIYASGNIKKIGIFFMGGEPLLQSELIKKIIPFGKRRASQHGKELFFSVTTNGTLISDDIVSFAQKNGLRFHLSIDGIPSVQDYNRPLFSGKASSPFVEIGASKVLPQQPNVTARSSVTPENVPYMLDSYDYFRRLGFKNIALIPSERDRWNTKDIEAFEKQYLQLGEKIIQEYRSDKKINLAGLQSFLTRKERNKRGRFPCGAGRGMVLISSNGEIWPCSRFSGKENEQWCLGSIYGEFHLPKRQIFTNGCPENVFHLNCKTCEAIKICDGGCLAENLEVTGDVYTITSSDCCFNRIYAKTGKHVHDILYAEKCPTFIQTFYPSGSKTV
jgi:uncharacterized protein